MRLTLFILLALPFVSCKEKVKHKDALEYLVVVSKSIAKSDTQETFLREMDNTMHQIEAKNYSANFAVLVDSLQIHYKEITTILDKRFKDVTAIKDVDPAFNLREEAITILKRMKKLHELNSVLVFELIPNKFVNDTKEQGAALKELKNYSNEFNDENHAGSIDSFVEKLLSFQNKYKITEAELQANGL